MPTAEHVRPGIPVCDGWRRAYLEWRVRHGRALDAVAEGVKREDTWQLVHELFESALRTGFERGHGDGEVNR